MGLVTMGSEHFGGMKAARYPGTEQEQATLTVDRCGAELRQARELARRANEAVRRALRGVEEAEVAFHLATRRLDRTAGLQVRAP